MATMSPRLPSPPPPAEIQIGPKSPGLGSTADQEAQQMEQAILNANSKRRIHPGAKSSDMAAGPPLVPLNELDSAFQLQEHLAALHYHHTAHNTHPITRETAALLATPPPSTDKSLWLYELCRFLIAQCNSLIVGFLFDTPPCSATTCPEMRASEWQFLCAVHEQPKSCCAIDYCCHTLDWAANVVTNPKLFPSRFVALSGGDGIGPDKNTAVKNLVNVFRRLHRIFAHAWFQHRGVFWSVEGQTGLYVLFKTVCDLYDTLPAENYKLPPEAEGLESVAAAAENMERGSKKESSMIPTPTIQQRPDDDNLLPPGRTNTRRHIRGSPSTGSIVTTVMEADEDDGTDVANKLREMRISTPETVEEEPEVAEVPVIVEQGVIDDAQSVPISQVETPAAEPDTSAKDEVNSTEHELNIEVDGAAEEGSKPEVEGQSEPKEGEAPVNGQEDGQEDGQEGGQEDRQNGEQNGGQEDGQEETLEETITEVENSDSSSSAQVETDPATISTHDFAQEKTQEDSVEKTEVQIPEVSTEDAKGDDKPEEPQNLE